MNETRIQHLTEAFNSIISMMLASLRVRGWRGLLDLPNIIMAGIYLRHLARQFSNLLASVDLTGIDLSALPPAPAPAPQAAPASPTQGRTAPQPRHRAPRAASAPAIPAAPEPPPRRTRIPRRARRQAPQQPRGALIPYVPATLLADNPRERARSS